MTDIDAIARGRLPRCTRRPTSRSPARSWARPTWARASGCCRPPTSRTTSCPSGPARRWPTCSGSAAAQPAHRRARAAAGRSGGGRRRSSSRPGGLPRRGRRRWRCWRPTGCRCRDHRLCRTADEAVAFAEEIGFPVVLRVVSPQIVHKSEVQGVALNLADAEAVREAFEQMQRHVAQVMPEAEIHGMLVRG